MMLSACVVCAPLVVADVELVEFEAERSGRLVQWVSPAELEARHWRVHLRVVVPDAGDLPF